MLAPSPLTGTPSCSVLPLGGVLPPPPSAAVTAALASSRPAPQPCEQEKLAAVLLMVLSTCAGVSGLGATDCISATTPATCGVAIEVPL